MRSFATWTWATVAAVLFFGPLTAWCAVPEFVPGRILVKFKPGVATAGRAALRAQLGGTRLKDLGIIRAELVAVPHLDVARAIALARRDPSVEYAEPDYILTTDAVPNDARFGELWAMQNTGQTGGTPGADIRATAAWDLFTGAPGVRVGVIDTGIDYTHPDLAANMWVNPGEIPGNEVDDDGNGYVDDVHGYDFYNGDGDPMDDNGHGTHCAGTIAAVGNNGLGVAGVTWNCTLVAIKTLGAGGSGPTSNAVAALQYAVANDIALTSDSWGGGAYSQSLLDAIEAAGAAGQIFVAAAGNTGTDTDASPHYPSSYPSAHVLAVLSTNHNDVKANSSNYGGTTVDLGAPGVNILSCQPGGGYQTLSGTSMAAPHVSGACALLWGRFPGMTNLQVKERILGTIDVLASLDGKCVTGGRLNVLRALSDPDATAPAAIADLVASDPGSTTLLLRWTATGDDGNAGSAWRTELRFATAPIDSASWPGAILFPTPPPEAAGTPQSVEVSGLAPLETYSLAIRAFDEFGNASPISNAASGTTLGAASIATSSLSPVQLLTGQQATQTLVVSNLGQGRLDFSIPTPILLLKSNAAAMGTQFPVLELGKHAADPRKGTPVLGGAGGPDAGGYRWTDSDAPGGPLFDWIDITSAGTPVGFTSDDQNLGPFPIGFEFPFYGTRFDAVRLCTNGWLSFTSTATRFTNQPLPTGGTSNPENLVAPFWDDLNFSTQGQAYWYGDGSRFIVAWVGVPHAGALPAGGPYTFQVILEPSGEIRYQYLAMGLPLDSSTIGIQNADRSVGLQVAFNADYVHDNLAIKIRSLPQWLTVSPASGRVLAGTSANVTVRFDASSLQGGDYDAVLRIVSNTTTSPTDLAATMQVTPAPQIVSSPAALDFGLAYLGYPSTRTLLVTNAGTAALDVTGITSSEPLLTASPASFSLAPAASQNVTLTWAPAAPSTLAGTVTIASNDPDEPTTVRSVSGSANYPPDLIASTSTLAARLVPNAVETQIVRISNGAAPSAAALEFTVSPLVYKAGAKAAARVAGAGRVRGARTPSAIAGPTATSREARHSIGWRSAPWARPLVSRWTTRRWLGSRSASPSPSTAASSRP